MVAGIWIPHNQTQLWMNDGTLGTISNNAGSNIVIYFGSIGSDMHQTSMRYISSVAGRITANDGNFSTTIQGLTMNTVNRSTVRYDCTDIVITAINTTINVKYVAIVNTANSIIIATCTLQTVAGTVDVSKDGTLTIQIASNGILQWAITQVTP